MEFSIESEFFFLLILPIEFNRTKNVKFQSNEAVINFHLFIRRFFHICLLHFKQARKKRQTSAAFNHQIRWEWCRESREWEAKIIIIHTQFAWFRFARKSNETNCGEWHQHEWIYLFVNSTPRIHLAFRLLSSEIFVFDFFFYISTSFLFYLMSWHLIKEDCSNNSYMLFMLSRYADHFLRSFYSFQY